MHGEHKEGQDHKDVSRSCHFDSMAVVLKWENCDRTLFLLKVMKRRYGNNSTLDSNQLLPALFTRCLLYSLPSPFVPKSELLSSSNPVVYSSLLKNRYYLKWYELLNLKRLLFNWPKLIEFVKWFAKYWNSQILLNHFCNCYGLLQLKNSYRFFLLPLFLWPLLSYSW